MSVNRLRKLKGKGVAFPVLALCGNLMMISNVVLAGSASSTVLVQKAFVAPSTHDKAKLSDRFGLSLQ